MCDTCVKLESDPPDMETKRKNVEANQLYFDSEGMIKEPHDNQETLSLITLLLHSVDCRYPPARFLISLGEGLFRPASGPGDCSL